MEPVGIVTSLSAIVVLSFCTFLIGLAGLIATKPSLAERFLASFASSARAHYTEQSLRLLVGAAMVNFAPLMWFPELFRIFGGLLVLTAAGLLLIPWRWHQKFGNRAIPLAIRHMKLLAVGATLLAGLILYGVLRPLIS